MKAVLFILTIILSVTDFVRAQSATAVAEPKIAAIINGEVITVDRVNQLYEQLSPETRQSYERAGGRLTFLQNYLIKKRLILQEAAKANFADQPAVRAQIMEARDAVVYDQYVRQIVGASVVAESDIRGYYLAHKKEFEEPEMVKARHIIVTPTEGGGVVNTTQNDAKSAEEAAVKIEMIAAQLARGAAFTDLAAQMSEDGTASVGGDLGWFAKGRMVPEFETVAFALALGQVSPVVETQFGFHIIRVDERRAARVRPLAEVHDLIRNRLLTENSEKVLAEVNGLTMQLRTASKVSVYPENF